MSFVIGTAGHIDHGKSTLITALTGIDPDRLAEEKRRGMTIDLGFAHLRLPSGLVWRLRASGAELGLSESIYLGSGELKATRQVVLSGTTGPNGALVRWAIRREGRAPGPGEL